MSKKDNSLEKMIRDRIKELEKDLKDTAHTNLKRIMLIKQLIEINAKILKKLTSED